MQDEEMGVGSRALLDDGVEDIGEDEIIEPTFGSAPGFGQSRRPNNPFPHNDKLWAVPPNSSSEAVWGQQDKHFLWGNMPPLSGTDDIAFRSWDSSPSVNAPLLTDYQERIRDIIRTADRNDPLGYVFVDNIMTQLKRQNPMDRSTSDDIVIATQAAPTAFLVQPKNGKWAVRLTNPVDSREVSRARMMTALGPKPGTPPSELGRSMLGSLAEVVRGFD